MTQSAPPLPGATDTPGDGRSVYCVTFSAVRRRDRNRGSTAAPRARRPAPANSNQPPAVPWLAPATPVEGAANAFGPGGPGRGPRAWAARPASATAPASGFALAVGAIDWIALAVIEP